MKEFDISKRAFANDYWSRKLNNADIFKYNTEVPHLNITKRFLDLNKCNYFKKLTGEKYQAEFIVLFHIYNSILRRFFIKRNFTSSNGFEFQFENALAFKNKIIADTTFQESLKLFKNEVISVHNHQDSDHQNNSELYSPFSFNYIHESKPETDSVESQFDCLLKKVDNELVLQIKWDSAFTEKFVVEQFFKAFEIYLKNLEVNVDLKFTEESLLDSAGEASLIDNYISGGSLGSVDGILDRFDGSVLRNPEFPALVFKERMLTYRELDVLSEEFAHYLLDVHRVSSGDFIAVKLHRDENLLVVLLGILKCGCAYVPIDIDYPVERIAFIESDSDCSLSIDHSDLECFQAHRKSFSGQELNVEISVEDPAYVIYTSGTTGNPKGVVVTHGNLGALIGWADQEYSRSLYDMMYAVTSYCFDLSVFEFFYPLSTGKSVRILQSGISIADYLGRDKKVFINTVPSTVQALIAEGADLVNVTAINLAGERFPVTLANYLKDLDMEVRNLYGPSEDTTYTTCYKLSDNFTYKRYVPVGRPISGKRVYILDDNLKMVPVGVPGKLYTAGAGVTSGYLNRSDLTGEKFLRNSNFPEGLLYATGDTGRWHPDGNIEFLGRDDNQLKLRGHRIEPGEIEYHLEKHPQITQSVVTLEGDGEDKHLIAYYTGVESVSSTDLERYLQKELPYYMVPKRYHELREIPLTLNGKIDYKELSKNTGRKRSTEYKAPETEIEKQLVSIWEEVLRKEQIGVEDNFFELGGHSLLVGRLINKVYRKLNLKIKYKEFLSFPTVRGMIQESTSTVFTPIPKAESRIKWTLSNVQKKFWHLSQTKSGSITYNVNNALRIKGHLNVEKLKDSFQNVVASNEILRASFKSVSGSLYQSFSSNPKPTDYFESFNFQKFPQNEIDEFLRVKSEYYFDLKSSPLFKVVLVSVANREYILMLVIHHIICDEASIFQIFSELFKNYISGGEDLNNNRKLQFSDYLTWNENEKINLEDSRDFWKEKFRTPPTALSMPMAKDSPRGKTFAGDSCNLQLKRDSLTGLNNLCLESEITLFSKLLAITKILLFKYSGVTDFVTGVPVSKRSHPDLEKKIGPFLDVLPIRTGFDEKQKMGDYVNNQHLEFQEFLNYSEFDLESVLEELSAEWNQGRSGIFDVLVVMEDNPETILSRLHSVPDLQFTPYSLSKNFSQVDLSFIFSSSASGLNIRLEYNTDIFEKEDIENLLLHFENIINQISNTKSINNLSLLDSAGEASLIDNYISGGSLGSVDGILDRFDGSVLRNPEFPALVFKERMLTYRELDVLSEEFAHYLLDVHRVSSGDFIAVKLHRDENLLVVLLGILKCGCAYVPIDIDYPVERIAFIESDSDCSLSIDHSDLECFQAHRKSFSGQELNVEISVEDPAYVIYTSGTTGNPKGVVVTHGNLGALIGWADQEYSRSLYDMMYAVTSYCFDLSVFEFFYPLSTGKSVRILQSGISIADYLGRDKKVFINTVPSTVQALIAEGADLVNVTAINLAGERFPVTLANYLKDLDMEVRNLYGPSEDTTYTTCYKLSDNFTYKRYVPVGRPISGKRVYILDDNLKMVPVGVPGKLYTAGAGVTSGYLNRSDLTGEKFLRNSNFPEGLLYATGDTGRWHPDGNIEFLGRDDNQLKLRGHRIEPGEIEYHLEKHPQITQSVVTLEGDGEDKHLIAYYTGVESVSSTDLERYLQKELPYYMVPKRYHELREIPLTLNGKIDYKELSKNTGRKRSIEYKAPETEIEKQLVSIWEEVLRKEQIGVEDNFFELGGHSLRFNLLKTRIEETFGVVIPYRVLYDLPVLKNLYQYIKNAEASIPSQVVNSFAINRIPLSSAQERIWFLSNIIESKSVYNIYGGFSIEGALDLNRLVKAYKSVVEGHEILRTAFKEEVDGGVFQNIIPVQDIDSSFGFKKINKGAGSSFIDEKIDDFINSPFNLNKPPLLNVLVLELDIKEFIIIFKAHHIIFDEHSLKIFKNEWLNRYLKQDYNPKTVQQFRDYINWELNFKSSSRFVESEKFWKNKLAESNLLLEFPSSFKRKQVKTYNGKKVSVELDLKLIKNLDELCRNTNSTMFTGLMSVLNIVIAHFSNQNIFVIGTPVSARDEKAFFEQLGLFLNTIPLKVEITSKDSLIAIIKKSREELLTSFEHKSYPYEKIIKDLKLGGSVSHNPLFEIMVSMVYDDTSWKNLLNSNIKDYPLKTSKSKFDLDFQFVNQSGSYFLDLVYNSDLFSESLIDNVLKCFENILNITISKPNISFENLDFNFSTKVNERADLSKDSKQNGTFPEIIIESFKINSEKVAIRESHINYTYRELDLFSETIANKLVFAKNKPVGIYLSKSAKFLISCLAVLRSGCYFVPLDVSFPKKRLAYIIDHSNLQTVITTDESDLSIFPPGVDILNYNELLDTSLLVSKFPKIESCSLAYLIYTSGSTGKPKGVSITHEALTNFLTSMKYRPGFSEEESLYSVTTPSFDICLLEFFLPLISGGQVIIPENSIIQDPKNIVKDLENFKPSVIQGTPSFFQRLFNSGWRPDSNLKVFCGGDELTESLAKQFLEENVELWNMYGPTETTIWSSCKRIESIKDTRDIGSPVLNTTFSVINSINQQVPFGGIGLLHIGGTGVMDGYYNDENLNSIHIYKKNDIRTFITGDLVKWENRFVFLGRNDSQIKLRGFRIDLSEITAIVSEIPHVDDCVVIPLGKNKINSVLACLYVAKNNISPNSIRERLKEYLPEYMIPSIIKNIDVLPVTPNDKIDYQKLSTIAVTRLEVLIVPPSTITEKKLMQIWNKVLEKPVHSIKSNFFESGGHSLNLTQISHLIEEEFNFSLELNDLFQNPSIAEQAEIIDNIQKNKKHSNNQEFTI